MDQRRPTSDVRSKTEWAKGLRMTNDELNALVKEWHTTEPEDGYNTSLHEYLGMTWDEYAEWTKTGIVPRGMS